MDQQQQQREEAASELLYQLYAALPIVEDAKLDPCYKPGDMHKRELAIRKAIADAEAAGIK
jgi:hypothetical protein